jgi:hypothetical protein
MSEKIEALSPGGGIIKNPDHDHVQWRPAYDGKGGILHWVCSCGAIVPDPPDFHPEESLELVIEEVVRAFQELLATSAPTTDETPAMIKLLRNLQAAIDEWNRSKDGKTS